MASAVSTTAVLPRRGAANVSWRCVLEDDLWRHPLAVPLPCTLEDDACIPARWVHQRHYRWSAIRAGVLTSSSMSAVCGLHERTLAARQPALPKHLVSHSFAVEAYAHLRGSFGDADIAAHAATAIHTPPPKTDATSVCHVIDTVGIVPVEFPPIAASCDDTGAWTTSDSHSHAFKYSRVCGEPEPSPLRDIQEVRKAWGRAHEATGILALLNALHTSGQSVRLIHCGVCIVAAAWLPDLSPADAAVLPQLGATPDGIILHEDGRVRVVEVKCTAPFTAAGGGDFALNCEPSKRGRGVALPLHMMPQLQLQIVCCGPRCDGAYAVHLTATRGCSIVFVPRDDDFIAAMLHRAAAFVREYVRAGVKPREDFSNDVFGKAFVDSCARAATRAVPIAHVAHEQVQRAAPDFVPLLLER